MAVDHCPLLPSAGHAERLVNGEAAAIPLIAFDIVLRAALIGTGMYVLGARKDVVKHALGGSLAVEAFVLTYIVATKP